jgi:hypothetical protein
VRPASEKNALSRVKEPNPINPGKVSVLLTLCMLRSGSRAVTLKSNVEIKVSPIGVSTPLGEIIAKPYWPLTVLPWIDMGKRGSGVGPDEDEKEKLSNCLSPSVKEAPGINRSPNGMSAVSTGLNGPVASGFQLFVAGSNSSAEAKAPLL